MKKIRFPFVLGICFALNVSVSGQLFTDTIFYNAFCQPTDSLKLDGYYRTITFSTDSAIKFAVKEYYANGSLKMEGSYTAINPDKKEGLIADYFVDGTLSKRANYTNNLLHGLYQTYFESGEKKHESVYHKGKLSGTSRSWYKSGVLKKELHYTKGLKNGAFQTYYPNGNLLRTEVFENGIRVSKKCLSQSGTDTTFFEHFTLPVFEGGSVSKFTEWVVKCLDTSNYTNNQQFKLLVGVTVNELGHLEAIKFPERPLSKLTLLLVSILHNSPKWQPARQDLEPVSVSVKIPLFIKRKD